jgi:hypothetical protein
MVSKNPIDFEQIMVAFQIYGLNINPAFLSLDRLDIPVLLHVKLLLEAARDGEIKLTTKGNLPVKIVEKLAKTMPTPNEKRYLDMTKRFLEEEQNSALRARALCEIAKLLHKFKGQLLLTEAGEYFLQRSAPEQFLSLLYIHLEFNIGYLDRAQETSLLNDIQLAVLQLLRDKEKMYRSVDVYFALLIDQHPNLFDLIEEEIIPDSIFSDDPMDEFERLLEIRLFKNYLVPFGLAEERGGGYKERAYECSKTELLDLLVQGVNAIDFDVVLSKKRIHLLTQRIKEEHLDVALFDDIIFMFSRCITTELPDKEMFGAEMVEYRRLAKTTHQDFYETLGSSILETIRAYTQLDAKGSRSDLKDGFESFIGALFAIVPQNLPFDLFQSLNKMPEYLMGWIHTHYKIELDQEFSQRIEERFNEDVLEDIGNLLMSINQLHKATKKSKRINTQTQQLAKESLMAFLFVVLSIYTFEMDR